MASQWLEEVTRALLFFPLKHQSNDTESPVYFEAVASIKEAL